MANAMSDRSTSSAPEQAIVGLEGVAAARKRGPAPVHLWNPPFCGEIDMRIASDGTWYYAGSPIGRQPLVELFASILRKDGERYFLVTPVERVAIRVDDAPFLAIAMQSQGAGETRQLSFRSNVDDEVIAGAEHPLRFETGAADGLKPYVHIRAGLWALVKRALFYDLAALGEPGEHNSEAWFGVRSQGVFFPMRPMREIDGL